MRHFLALLDAFFLTRPLLLAPVWGFSVFGLFRGLSAGGRAPMNMLWTVRHNGATFGWMAIFSLSVASVYVLNQIADVNVDKFNKGLPLLAKGKLSLAAAWWTAILCLALSILLPFFSHPSISAFSCGAALLGIAYSFRPLRFSGRPCFDFLTNAAGYGLIAFGVGWHLSGAAFSVAGFAASALPYFLLMCAGSISSTFPDYEGDKKCGKITTAVALGVRRAHAVATVSLCSSLAVSVALGDAHSADMRGRRFAVLYFLLYPPRGPRHGSHLQRRRALVHGGRRGSYAGCCHSYGRPGDFDAALF